MIIKLIRIFLTAAAAILLVRKKNAATGEKRRSWNERWHRRETFTEAVRTAGPILIFLPIFLICFSLLEEMTPETGFRTDAAIDAGIPLVPVFVIPYFLWFLYIPVSAAYLLMRDVGEFRHLQALLIGGMTAFLILNACFPTSVSLRPAYVAGNDICSVLVRWLYRTDTQTNVLPSLHAYNTMAVWFCLTRSEDPKLRSGYWSVLYTSLSVLIILSTLLLRQHSVLDLAVCLPLCAVCHGIWCRRERRKLREYIKVHIR